VHIVTLSFDDGFERSSIRTAEIFERHGLVVELNVIAAGHHGMPDEEWHRKWRKDDFGLWNELKARGHRVMPHGLDHVNKAGAPLAEAKRLIEACLDVFHAELAGFEASEASFAFPYNRSTPDLETWLRTRVRAFRTGGDPVMALPSPNQQRVTCASFGPGRCDDHLSATIDAFLAGRPGWLCYTFMGSTTKAGGRWGATRSTACWDVLSRMMSACSRSPLRST
jgi:peptidoglycan/xylan/chitin deacetylase (PgdA/CDA1 family)